MLEFIFAPENLPFVAAFILMLMIGLVEAVGLGAGGFDLDLDGDGGFDAPLLAWLGVGAVPILVFIVILLALFGILGIGVQQIASALTGAPLSPWLAAPLALLVALPLSGFTARGVGHILPGDETTAVGLETLVGREAIVTIGTARVGSPARASVRDAHQQVHYVMVEPTDAQSAVETGESLLLVGLEHGIFKGLAKGEALIGSDGRPVLLG